MKPSKTLYQLALRSRPREGQSAEDKHHRFFADIRSLSSPWGGGSGDPPLPPRFGGGVIASGSLTKWFGRPFRRVEVLYRFRRTRGTDGSDDDVLTFSFTAEDVDLARCAFDAVPRYVEAFDAYLCQLFNDEVIFTRSPEFDTPTNPREQVAWIAQATYVDEALCRAAFKMGPTTLAERCRHAVDGTREIGSGVLIVASTAILSPEETLRRSRLLTAILSG